MVNQEQFFLLKEELERSGVILVAVSKTQPAGAIRELYDLGLRDFGENYVQELLSKAPGLPADIRWHFIGHLQTNKARQIVGLVQLIQGVDSLRLLEEINRQAARKSVIQDCLLQVHIAREDTKFGLDEKELAGILETDAPLTGNVRIRGLMGMASLTADEAVIDREFEYLSVLYETYRAKRGEVFDILSMGMSGDYRLAIRRGASMVRIGSLLFGARV